jgi:Bacterial Ig domain
MTINVTGVNDAPAGTDNTLTMLEDGTHTFAAAEFGFTDPNDSPANALQAVVITTLPAKGTLKLSGAPVTAGQEVAAANIPNLTFQPVANENGTPYTSFTFQVRDDGGTANGGIDIDQSPNRLTFNVTPVNDSPVVGTLTVSPASLNEGNSANLSGSFTDPDDGDTHTVTIAWGDGSPNSVLNLAAGEFSFSATHPYADDNPTATPSDVNSIVVTVTDNGTPPLSGNGNTSITVNNVAPVLSSLTPSVFNTPIGSAVTVTGHYSDVGKNDTHTCYVNWDDGTPTETVAGTTNPVDGTGTCSATRTISQQGVYTISMYVRDDDTGQSETLATMVTVFDPNGGFVTGGGWIMSPVAACQLTPACVAQTGKANFGFVSKYRRGSNTPEGQTEFQFKAGDLNFHSTTYDYGSLIVQGYKAQYKGTGTINGVPGYTFVLTAYDAQAPGGVATGGVDRFRMKIKYGNLVVYDNRMGAPDDVDTADPMAISGGSIVIHKP